MNKKVYLEIMRIIACVFVIFDHLSNFTYNSLMSIKECNYLFWYNFSRFSVPLFFMISGALILDKQFELKKYFSRIIRVIIVLVVFSTMYYAVEYREINISSFIRSIYSSCSEYNPTFWFLYAYIGFLVVSPFLQLIAKNMTQYHFNILIVIMVFNSIIAVFEFFMSRGLSHPNQIILQGFNGDISWLTNTSVFYPLIGFYIDHKCNLKNINKKLLLLLWIVNISSIVLSIVLTYYKYNILNFTDDDYQVFRWTFTYINTATIFITIKNIFDENYKLSPKLQKYIIALSECTFGIYLIHLWVVNYVHKFINCYNVSLCCIVSICVFLFCFIIIRLLKFIPIINKYI